MKKGIMLLCIAAFLLCGCQAPANNSFENKDEPVQCVELLFYPYAYEGELRMKELLSNQGSNENYTLPSELESAYMEFKLIRSLEAEETSAFLERLYALQTSMWLGDPPSDYGSYIVRIYYENGDVGYYGSRHIEMVQAGDNPCAVGVYTFKGDAFEELYFEYAGNIDNLKNAFD